MKPTVLIVDDTPASVLSITAALGDPYHVLTAETGESGIELALQSDPDVILLDVMLPRMDGYAVCTAVRRSPRISAIPIVMISALDDRASRIAGLDAGADEFISKPIDALELRVRVRTIVRMNRFRRLLEAREQFEMVFHSSPDPVIVVNQHTGAVALGNTAAAEYIDPRRSFIDMVVDEDRPRLRDAFTASHAGSPTALAVRLANVHGQEIAAELTCVSTGWEGQLSAIVAIRNVSARLEAEALARRAERTQSALEATASLGHDFGNYLMTIQGGVDLIERQLNGNGADLVQVVNDNIDRGAALVKRITALARGAVTLNLRRLQLATFVDTVEPSLRHLLGPVTLKTISEVDCPVVADSAHLEQALVNLVTNAKQAIHGDGAVEVRIRCEDQGNHPTRELSLSVTDTGCGIPPEIQERMFEPYFTTREAAGGTGLGLATVHSLVTAQGGRLEVTSEVGKGTSISMIWPCGTACEGCSAAMAEQSTRRAVTPSEQGGDQ